MHALQSSSGASCTATQPRRLLQPCSRHLNKFYTLAELVRFEALSSVVCRHLQAQRYVGGNERAEGKAGIRERGKTTHASPEYFFFDIWQKNQERKRGRGLEGISRTSTHPISFCLDCAGSVLNLNLLFCLRSSSPPFLPVFSIFFSSYS